MTDHSIINPGPTSDEDNVSNDNLATEQVESPVKEFEQLFVRVEDYTRTTFELAKLKALDASTTVVTTLATKLVALLLAATFMLILSIGVSIWLGELLNNSYYGFFIVATFYLVLTIIFQQFLQPMISKVLSQAIIQQALK